MSEIIHNYLQINVALAPVISIILRTTSIVLAPVPGTPIDLLNLAFFNKLPGFIYAEISIIVGSSINFWIARKFGKPVVGNFIPIEKIDLWEKRIEEKSGFFGLTMIRMFTISIFDYLSYVAGLTRMSFGKFVSTSILASIPPVAAFYYFGGIILEKGLFLAMLLIAPFILLGVLFHKGKIFKKFYDYLKIKDGMERVNEFFKKNN